MSQDSESGIHLTVKVVPDSSRTEIAGVHGQMLKIKVAAVAEKGRANKALLEFLAKQLGIRKNALTITSGQTSCVKQICIEGVTEKDVEKIYQ